MVSDQRHIHDPPTSLPHASQFKFLYFCFRLCPFLFLTVAMSSSRVASSLDIVCPHERAMMTLQSLLAGNGLNWCGESGLDHERLSSSDSDTTLPLPPSRPISTCTTSLTPSALALSRSGMASPSPTPESSLSWRWCLLLRPSHLYARRRRTKQVASSLMLSSPPLAGSPGTSPIL